MQEHCDSLFTDLLKAGYSALTLHGGKDQVDRDETVSDFKSGAGERKKGRGSVLRAFIV